MTITRIDRGQRMSQSVVHAGLVYLSGQVGTPGASVAAQTREVLAQVEDLLARSGSSKRHMLMATIWLADMGDFDEMNTIWDAWVADIAAPARATCGVGPATRAYKVEIIVTAAVI